MTDAHNMQLVMLRILVFCSGKSVTPHRYVLNSLTLESSTSFHSLEEQMFHQIELLSFYRLLLLLLFCFVFVVVIIFFVSLFVLISHSLYW